MAENTKIEWAHHTFNPWFGCTKVSPGCDHCYAEARMDTRLHRVSWGPGQPRVRTQTWGDPVKWNMQQFVQCAACGYRCELRHFHAVDGPADFTMCPKCSSHDYHGARARVFCASLADVFDNEVDPRWRQDLFELIARTPNLDWLLLTKRIGNAPRMIEEAFGPLWPFPAPKLPAWPWPNVWIGATIVNQAEADRDIPKLLAVPAAKRFLSMEPLLGPVDLTRVALSGGLFDALRGGDLGRSSIVETWPGLDWVIVGGESGPGARPMHPDWARSLRDQCQAAGVPFLFKQWGEWLPLSHQTGGADPEQRQCQIWPDGRPYDGETEDMTPECVQLSRVGKKAAGRLLDGRTWDEVPT